MANEVPKTMDAAGWMALPIGLMWSASFLCTMYGTERPFLSMLSTVLAIISIYMLYKQLTNYYRLYPSVSWLHILRLSFVTCLLAGLLTDMVQYAYFLWLDNGRLLSILGTSLQSEEYREAWKKMMPEVDLNEMQKKRKSHSTFFKESHSLNVRSKVIGLYGRTTLLSVLQPMKASLPIVVTESGISTSIKPVFPKTVKPLFLAESINDLRAHRIVNAYKDAA